MGHPHATVDVPGRWPAVAAEVRRVGHDPFGQAAVLLGSLTRRGRATGHVCATAWLVHDGALLLVRHRRLGWSAPGGHLMVGETVREAALRELAEETGMTAREVVADADPLCVHAADVPGPAAHRHWNVAWALRLAPGVDPATARGEAGQPVAWFRLDALPADAPADLAPVAALLRPVPPAPGTSTAANVGPITR